jgi:NADPH-dependent F420 reductase
VSPQPAHYLEEKKIVNNEHLPTLAVLGGTGNEGGGLALRWASAGYKVLIGSRSQEKAEHAAAEMNLLLGLEVVDGLPNAQAAEQADIVVLSVPYAAHQPTLENVRDQVQGKILIDLTVPLRPPAIRTVTLPEGGSAAQEAQALLGESVRVVSAFQNVSAVHLKDLERSVDCDILVTGDDKEAKQVVIDLAEAAGMRGIDAGPLANAVAAESLTPILVGINRRYKVKGAGIRITGLD